MKPNRAQRAVLWVMGYSAGGAVLAFALPALVLRGEPWWAIAGTALLIAANAYLAWEDATYLWDALTLREERPVVAREQHKRPLWLDYCRGCDAVLPNEAHSSNCPLYAKARA